MCGLAGFCDFTGRGDVDVLRKITDRVAHRGPDDSGYEVVHVGNVSVGLGHRRLSIIDISSSGHQPMNYEHLSVIFNGEIYNYRELKKELQEKNGYEFITGSDTEVILKAYHAWGIECVQRFIGMFAIVILDQKKSEITLIRDRAGVKPLYWLKGADHILFASELKSFRSYPSFSAEIDSVALGQFFKYGYIPAPLTIFKNGFKVKPGHCVKINLQSRMVEEKCYWDIIDYYNKPKLEVSLKEAIEQTEKILISACNYRMVADVPVGVFLSGGYDSSIVTALLQRHSGEKIKTFTIGFHEDEFNEATHARKIAQYLGVDHHEHYCSISEAKSIIPELPKLYDEPFGDSSAIPTVLVSKVAVNHVKVALSADAGDELFAGYGNYAYFLEYYNRIQAMPLGMRKFVASLVPALRTVLRPVDRLFYNFDTRLGRLPGLMASRSPVNFNAVTSEYFTSFEIRDLVIGKTAEVTDSSFFERVDTSVNDFINVQLAIGFKTFLVDDILTKVDRATMSVGLEGREPLLDHRIAEYVAQLPSDYKYRNGISKFLLKEITHKYIPRELIDRPKMGFSIPVERWLRGDLKFLLTTYLDKDRIAQEGLLNPAVVQRIKQDFLNGKRFNFSKIWFLLMFQMWSDMWLTGNK